MWLARAHAEHFDGGVPMITARVRLCGYRYDALDRLVAHEPAGQEPRQRFYSRQQLITEIQGPRSGSIFQHDCQLLALRSQEQGAVNSRLLAIDQQRSVMHLTGADENARWAYAPYGHRCGINPLLGFAGEAIDPVTGHYLLGNGYRAYNPVLMRFNSPDRLSPFGQGGLNPYAYCLGDPVNLIDPSAQSAEIARLFTGIFSFTSARISMSPAIPYKIAKNALQRGAAGELPSKYTAGAAGSVIAGVSTAVASITASASAVAAINKDTEAAAILGFIALGLAALTLAGRAGSGWVARDPKALPALKRFADERKGPVPLQSPEPVATRSPESLIAPAALGEPFDRRFQNVGKITQIRRHSR